jgi:cell pole-organizing protein PopZ
MVQVLAAQAAEMQKGEQRGQLISREANNAVHAAFHALEQTILVNKSRELEDVIRDMLQPMLKIWLDDNLPGMVERLVRVEIEQISRPQRLASPTSRSTDRLAS